MELNKNQENSSRMFNKINTSIETNSTLIHEAQRSVKKMTEDVNTSLKGFRETFVKIDK